MAQRDHSRNQENPILKSAEVRTILFDMDGVITSERKYWEAGGLTVAEILWSEDYVGLDSQHFRIGAPLSQLLDKAKRLLPDEIILALKSRAISTNWDITYMVASLHIIQLVRRAFPISELLSDGLTDNTLRQLGYALKDKPYAIEDDTELVRAFLDAKGNLRGYELIDSLNDWLQENTKLGAELFTRGDGFWKLCQDLFQEWYLGDRLFEEVYGRMSSRKGKIGLIKSEAPLLPLEKLDTLFRMLRHAGYRLGIATGRPYEEIVTPLQDWGLLEYFDRGSIATHREVEQGEQSLAEAGIRKPLSKPDPFVFLRAIHPEVEDLALDRGDYSADEHARVVVVGDTVSDIRAAKKAGFLTIAVLTGIGGERARAVLIEERPDSVVKDVLCLSRVLGLEN